ncbi:MAG: hypothetical protein ACR2QE_21380 [Acidimicrobiales bacterium]
MERLRHVARAAGTPQRILVAETADALLDVVDDHAGLVTACRQMVQRQPTSAPLVWLAANLLSVDEPYEVVWDLVAEMDGDPTDRELAHALEPGMRVLTLGWPEMVTPGLARRGDLTVSVLDGPVLARRIPDFDTGPIEAPLSGAAAALARTDVVLSEAWAAGPESFLAPAGTTGVLAAAAHLGIDVWLVVPRGRALPTGLWNGLRRRLGAPSVEDDHEVVGADLVSAVVSPIGSTPLTEAIAAGGCPPAPELQ